MANTDSKQADSKKKISAHSRKVKKRYSNINISLWNIPSVQAKVKNITKLVNITKDNKKKADEIQIESHKLIKDNPPAQSLVDELSIATLHDVHDIETKGSVQKASFFDLMDVNNKRRDVLKIVESNNKVLSQIRETQIEVLQLQIEKLLEVSEEE